MCMVGKWKLISLLSLEKAFVMISMDISQSEIWTSSHGQEKKQIVEQDWVHHVGLCEPGGSVCTPIFTQSKAWAKPNETPSNHTNTQSETAHVHPKPLFTQPRVGVPDSAIPFMADCTWGT